MVGEKLDYIVRPERQVRAAPSASIGQARDPEDTSSTQLMV
jgi:hypothetical protein